MKRAPSPSISTTLAEMSGLCTHFDELRLDVMRIQAEPTSNLTAHTIGRDWLVAAATWAIVAAGCRDRDARGFWSQRR
jgi:hypothetical protein